MLDPARGCSSTTMPSLPAFVVGRLRTTTRNPPERRLDAAVVVEGPLPVETFSVTFEPLSTSWPAAGFCATTVPAGFADGTLCSTGFSPAPVKALTAEPCDSPTTCGTSTGFAPLETLRL